MKNQKNILILLIVVIVLVGIFLYARRNSSVSPPAAQKIETQTKTFQSKNLKFNVIAPDLARIKEGSTYIEININNNAIDIVRNGTNFASLRDYLKDFDVKKGISVTEEKILVINNLQAISRVEINQKSRQKLKIYYVYVDNWVYSISTSSEPLFSDLDQIAQSFRYTP